MTNIKQKSAMRGTRSAATSETGIETTPCYVTRPKGKPDVTTKGRLNEWQNGYKEFIPEGQKPSNRTMLKTLGNSSFYKSEGEKESSWSVHLNVDGRSEDPVAEAFEQFKVLTAEQQKQKPMLPDGSQGRMLLDDGRGVQVWLDREKGQVFILATLDCGQDVERQLLQAQATMNVTVGRYRREIVNLSDNK
jgi:hypothetical protein